ncbi:MAG: hypothetical protein V1913_00790 [Fibrobacterota bacterium]
MDLKTSPIHSYIRVSKETEIKKYVRSVLFVSDSINACRGMFNALGESVANCIYISTHLADHAKSLCKHYYFDLIFVDMLINTTDKTGLLLFIRKLQPTAYVVALTRNSVKMGWLAGRGNTDGFIDSPDNYNALLEKVVTGLSCAMSRRHKIPMGGYKSKSDCFVLKKQNWRTRQKLRRQIGFSAREYKISRMKMKATALLLKKEYSIVKIATLAGFSTVQKMFLSLQRNPIVAIDVGGAQRGHLS